WLSAPFLFSPSKLSTIESAAAAATANDAAAFQPAAEASDSNSTVKSIGVVIYLRLLTRLGALLVAASSMVMLACWIYSIPIFAIAVAHTLVSFNSYSQYNNYINAPSGQTLQYLSVAKTSENYFTMQQIVLGTYFYVTTRMHYTASFKTPCIILETRISESAIHAVLIVFVILQLIDFGVAMVQYYILRSLKAKYEPTEDIHVTSAMPGMSNVESQKADLQAASPHVIAAASLKEQMATAKELRSARANSSKLKTAVVGDALIQIDPQKNKSNEPINTCPSTMSFNEKDLGDLKDVENEMNDLLRDSQEVRITSPPRPPKKPSKARKKKSEQRKKSDPVDKTQQESEACKTQKTQRSPTASTTKETKTRTRATTKGSGGSSNSKGSL
ncbi:hypothetical protein PFISCL1PPCAC_514, partial [Pristionchus fissidentatus]